MASSQDIRSHSSLPRRCPAGVLPSARLPMLAFHRIAQPVGTEALLLLSPSANASSLLRIVEGTLVGVIGLLTDNHPVLNHNLIHASTAALMPTGGRDPYSTLFRIGKGRVVGTGFGHRRQLRFRSATESCKGCSQCGNRSRSSHERPSAQPPLKNQVFMLNHWSSSSLKQVAAIRQRRRGHTNDSQAAPRSQKRPIVLRTDEATGIVCQSLKLAVSPFGSLCVPRL